MSDHSAETTGQVTKLPSLYRMPRAFFLLGVAWPTGTILFELLTRACTPVFFDPLPTILHILLALTVPLANALALWVDRGPPSRLNPAVRAVRAAAWVSGSIYGLAFFFLSIPALILSPFTVFMIFSPSPAEGLIAPATLGPLLGFLMLWRSSTKLKVVDSIQRGTQLTDQKNGHWKWVGAAICVALWGLAEGPMLITRGILEASNLANSSNKIEATQWLRRFGSERALRSICYLDEGKLGKSGPIEWIVTGTADLLTDGPLTFGNASIAPQMYFRAYGRPFDSLPPPNSKKGIIKVSLNRRNDENSDRGQVWDSGRGGDSIGPKMRGLSLSSSRLDWNVDEPSRLAYGEWTLEFQNDHTAPHEARCHMLLPPGAVVSRLTLWVNGEEREAAFAGKAQVKAAYRQVVTVEKRDPVMVNMIAPDCVMTQCFPVPAAGKMKIRLGITTPMNPPQNGILEMPRIIERNFFLSSDLAHQVWVQTKNGFELSTGEKGTPQKEGPHIWQGSIPNETMRGLTVKVPSTVSSSGKVWTLDKLATGPEKYLVRTPIDAIDSPHRKQIVIVDSSASVAPWKSKLKNVLLKRPKSVSTILITRDEGFVEIAASSLDTSWDQLKFEGGIDNRPALQRAATLASELGDDAEIVWIHGPQSFEFPGAEALEQFLERSASPLRIRSLQLESGRHLLLEKLFRYTAVHAATRHFSLDDEAFVNSFLKELESNQTFGWNYSRSTSPPEGLETGTEVWDHLARYEANERVLRGFKGTERPVAELAALAAQYQLVTPVSGAVVLETQAQYDRAGLKPIDPKTAANFNGGAPEPSRILLVGAGMLFLLFRRRRY